MCTNFDIDASVLGLRKWESLKDWKSPQGVTTILPNVFLFHLTIYFVQAEMAKVSNK